MLHIRAEYTNVSVVFQVLAMVTAISLLVVTLIVRKSAD
jgi:hypothetical protein